MYHPCFWLQSCTPSRCNLEVVVCTAPGQDVGSCTERYGRELLFGCKIIHVVRVCTGSCAISAQCSPVPCVLSAQPTNAIAAFHKMCYSHSAHVCTSIRAPYSACPGPCPCPRGPAHGHASAPPTAPTAAPCCCLRDRHGPCGRPGFRFRGGGGIDRAGISHVTWQ